MTSRFPALLLAAFAGALALSGSALATPAKEAPWLPEAAAYRLTLFLGNLEPLPWDDVEAAWSEPHRNSDFSFGALARLDEDSDVKPDTLMDAISSEDRHAVFAEATRLIALRLEEELDRAIAAESPATAQRAVREARELYRAFADGIAAADPEASRRIGRAWLELASSAGSPGLLGAGTTPTSTEAMATARAVISDYLADNYVNHQLPDAAGGTSSKSLSEWKALVADFHEGFSHVKMEVLLQVAEGDYVCSRWRLTATNTGAFRDADATGTTGTINTETV